MDQSKVLTPLAAMMQAMDQFNRKVRDTQIGVNEMVSGLRGAVRSAKSLADQMERVASYARQAAKANASAPGMRVQPAASTSGPSVAAAPAPRQAPPPLLTYDPRNFVTQGQPYIPGSALVPVGPGRQWDVAGPSPDRGALAVWAAAQGWTPPTGGTTQGAPYMRSGGALVRGGIPIGPLPTGAAPRGAFPMHDATMAGLAAGGVGIAAGDFVKHVFEAGEEPGAIIARMEAARFTPEQIAQSKSLARAMVGKIPGLEYSQGLDLINQTASFTGDVGEAIKLAPTLGFNAQVLAQFGKRDAIAQVESAVKAGELTGLSKKDGSIDTDKLIDFVNRLTSVVVSGGGTLDINKYLTGLKQFGLGAAAASVDFNTAVLPAYMKIMGESRAGTALASMQQVLLSPPPNTRSNRYQAEQASIGLRDAKGALLQSDLLQSDPFAYTTQFMLPLLAAKGFDTPGKIKGEIYKLFSRQTVDRLVGAGIFDESVINKEANRNRQQIAAGAAPLQKMLENSPTNNVAAFRASLNLFMATLADPNMGAATNSLKDMTNALRYLAAEAKLHPTLARYLMDAGVGVAVLGSAIGGLLLALAPALAAIKVGRWLSGPGALVNGVPSPSLGTGLGKVLGPLGLVMATTHQFKEDFANDAKPDAHGMYPQTSGILNGLSNIITEWKQVANGERDFWSGQYKQPVTVNVILDGKTIQRTVTTKMANALTAQTGPTAGDPRAVPTPPGATAQ